MQAARRELARELTRRGAEVWIAHLPPLTGVNGVDDLLGLYGLEKALEALKTAIRYVWRDELIVSGKALAILANVITTLRSAPEWHGVLAFNEHSRDISTLRDTPWGAVAKWTDRDTCLLVNWCQHHGLLIGLSDANSGVETVARDRSYHPVRDYLESLVWDKVSRTGKWLTVCLGVSYPRHRRAVAGIRRSAHL